MGWRGRTPTRGPWRWGGEPIAILVPPPHGVTGTPASPAITSAAATSSFVPGKITASGARPSTRYGEHSTPVSTCGAPTRPRSLSGRAEGTGELQRPALEALSEALFFDRMRAGGGR